MSGKSYSDLLKDPRWQRKRLEVLNDANWRCEECDNARDTLHVHHRIYRRGTNPWEYDKEELQCLCENCHDRVTQLGKRFDVAVAEFKAVCHSRNMSWVVGAMHALTGLFSGTETDLIDYDEIYGAASMLKHTSLVSSQVRVNDLFSEILEKLNEHQRINLTDFLSARKK